MLVLVVLNFNDSESTVNLVHSIVDYKSIDNIIIVDNCSTDDSMDHLSQLANDKVVLIKAKKNSGYASGNNFGIRYAQKVFLPDYIIVSNPDVEFQEDVVFSLCEQAKHLHDLGIITCKMNCTSDIYLPIAWKLPRFHDCLFENFILLKKLLHYNYEYPKEYFSDALVKVEVLPGSFFLITSDAFSRVNGFDEDTFLYYEENILGYKLKEGGFNNYLLTTCQYIHRHSVSINKSISSVAKRLRMNYNSRNIYCERYLRRGSISKLVLRISFEVGLLNYLIALKIIKKRR